MAQTHALIGRAAGWPRGPLVIAGIVAAICAIYWPTVRELAGLGARSDGQFLLVLGAFLFMVWAARGTLERLPIRPSAWGVAALGLLALSWLVGQLALVRLLTDASVVAMIPAAVLGLLGMAWVRALAFPLAFVLLAIPIEQPLAPVLAGWTADVLIPLLEVSGISVQREGAYFSIPSGRWAVADACSGVEYLTSCLVVSLFFAHTQFRSTRRRAAFIAGALGIGLAGNWIRAYLTVGIAHLSDNRVLYDDHGTFGWLVYATLFVIYGVLWWRFREPADESRDAAPQKPRRLAAAPGRVVAFASLAAILLLSARLTAVAATRSEDRPLGDVRIAQAGGWSSTMRPATAWTPALQNPARQDAYSFRKGDRHVDLAIGWFKRESWDSKLVSVANRLVAPEDSRWTVARRDGGNAEIAGVDSRVLVRQWYWTDGLTSPDPLDAKLAQLRARLLKGGGASAWIAISTPLSGRAAADLDAFVSDMGPALGEALAQTSVSSPR